MASQNRSASPAVTPPAGPPALEDVLNDASRYAFFQVMRLLRQRFPDEQQLRDRVRVRPALSLAFPDTDIERAHEDAQGRFHIEANFFGLYGVTSPLPTFYTEDLIQESMQGYSAMRDFLDILHASLYPLLYRAWEKYRLWLLVGEQGDRRRLNQLYALIGTADTPSWEADSDAMLPFAGLLSARPRSALGLQSLLQGMLQNTSVKVVSCVARWVAIPAAARTGLGLQASTLGEDSVLGEQVRDCAGNIDIEIGPLAAADFHALLPGARGHARMARVVAWYLPTPLRCRLLLWIEPSARQSACLGEQWARLGHNTWLGNGAHPRLAPRPVCFPLPVTLEANPS